MVTTISKLPEAIEKHYAIKLLGEPFSEMGEVDGCLVIRHGYIYNGVKYYESAQKLGKVDD